jgi:hypothetical protein
MSDAHLLSGVRAKQIVQQNSDLGSDIEEQAH